MRRRSIGLALALMVGASSGCVAVAAAGAGAGTYAFVKGKTEVNLDSPYNNVWHATGEALRALEVTITSQTRDALAGTYQGERHNGTNVVVDVESIARGKTKVGIRVGAFGNREYQENLVDDIKRRL